VFRPKNWRSNIWKHFERLPGYEEHRRVKCRHCDKVYVCNNCSTSNLWKHLKNTHPDLLDDQQPATGLQVAVYSQDVFREALVEFKNMNLPNWWWNQVELAYTYGQLGDIDNARNAVTKLLELYPGFDLERAVIEHQKFSFEPSYIELAVDGLRKAGVPEKTTVAEKL